MGGFFGLLVVSLFIVGFINSCGEDEADESSTASTSSDSQSTAEPPPPPPTWSVSQWTSAMDDSPAVSLTSNSESIYTGAYGGAPGPATLHLRCLENETNLYIKLNGHFLADIQNYGRVAYRIDGQQPRTMSMAESTDNEALGLWSGGQAIPVIRRMLNHDEVIMRVTPYNQSSKTITFPIDGIEEEIKPLRTACHW